MKLNDKQVKDLAIAAITAITLMSLPGSSVGVAVFKCGVGLTGCVGTSFIRRSKK